MAMKIYHNPRCKKSRDGLNYLKSREIEPEIIDYLKNGLTASDLKEIILKLHINPLELIRKNEMMFRKELKNLNLTDEEWMKTILENPFLMKRPVILAKFKGVIGDSVENIEKIL